MFSLLLTIFAASTISAVPFERHSGQSLFSVDRDSPTCPIDLPLSCSNSTPVENTCCFESPGGIFLQTQFWDYYPPIGPNDSFTLHGLWPDNCDGTYEQFCDQQLNVHEVSNIISKEYGDDELYEKMSLYWKNFNGNDESLWVHEFNKHATCIKTLRPQCYTSYSSNKNVYDFFKISMNIYEKLPTFNFLEQEGIVPSNSKVYKKEQIANALTKNFDGHSVFFKCNKYNALQEIWYYHYLQGSIKDQSFVRTESLLSSNCPDEGIKFLPKTGWKPPSNPHPQPPSSPNRGVLKLSDHDGCLISNGQWYRQGTCAKFQITKSQFGGYNIKSSKGICGIDANGQLNCNRQNQASQYQFSFAKDSKLVGYGGNTKWCLNYDGSHGDGKYAQIPIKLADSSCKNPFTVKFV